MDGPQFPVSRSLLAAGALARVIEEAYDLSQVSCTLIKATVNDVYHVNSTNGPYILRLHRTGGRNSMAITEELNLLDDLADDGLVVGPAVRRSNGERLLTFQAPEGPRYGVLFTFIYGVPFSTTPGLATVARYARAVARLHLLTDESPYILERPRYNSDTLLTQPLATIAQTIDRREVLSTLHAAAQRLHPIVAMLPTAPPGYGLIHGDLIPSNALIDANGLVALVDFDDYGLGWRALDLASYLNEVAYWEMPEAVATTFLREYAQLRPLDDWEWAALPALQATQMIAALATTGRHLHEWGSSYLSERMVTAMLAIIAQAIQRLD